MDNLTHSMAGAVLGQTGLKRTSGLGMAALVIGANIPDIDATCAFLGTQSLALRRGLTHGPIAWIVLPVLLTGLLVLFDRWQNNRGTRPTARLPVRPAWLLALSFIGVLSHVALDWLNSYGIRLLAPFSQQWFYGDVLFIIDLILWAILIGGFVWSRRAEKRDSVDWRRRAAIAMGAACIYIFANGAITHEAETQTRLWLRQDTMHQPAEVVANPVPIAFWRRDMLWRSADGYYGNRTFDLMGAIAASPPPQRGLTGMADPRVRRAASRSADARAFLFWSRMPLARFDTRGTLVLADQRLSGSPVRGNFTVTVPAEPEQTGARN